MPLKLTIPGADFSASTLPKFREQVAGFDAANLELLYLFENGSLGSSILSALDSSGKGRHGVLVSGSANPIKTAGGVDNNTANTDIADGFLFETGMSLAGERTIFLAGVSDLVGPAAASAQDFITYMVSKYAMPLNGNQNPSYPAMILNRQTRNTTTTTAAQNMNHGFYIGGGAPAGQLEGAQVGQVRPQITASPIRLGPGLWGTFAISISNANKRIRMVAGSSTGTFYESTENTYITALQTGQAINFGIIHNSGAERRSNGQLGIAGVYSKESTLVELRDLCTRMQQRMLMRGITAY